MKWTGWKSFLCCNHESSESQVISPEDLRTDMSIVVAGSASSPPGLAFPSAAPLSVPLSRRSLDNRVDLNSQAASTIDAVPLPYRPDPRQLVCLNCWEQLFCHGQLWTHTKRYIGVSTTVAELKTGAGPPANCNSCRLMLRSIELFATNPPPFCPRLLGAPESTPLEFRFSKGRDGSFEVFRTEVNALQANMVMDTYVLNGKHKQAMGLENALDETRDMNLDVTQEETFALARHWLEECTTKHPDCPSYSLRPLPSRVVDVGDSTQPSRLLLTHGVAAPYVALSYCWGSPQQYTTTCANIAAMTEAIDTSLTSTTIAHAITATRRLGLRYLWVDALCIIQDDESDKRTEIACMRDIYKNAYCTIVVESAADSAEGFLLPHSDIMLPKYHLPFLGADGECGAVYLRPSESYDYHPQASAINTRAWTLEERLLSPRKLIYTSKQVRWECQSHHALYTLLDAHRLHNATQFEYPEPTLTGTAKLKRFWDLLLNEYSARECTNPKDKLRAFGGLAAEFHNVFPEDRYVAGLWREWVFVDLLWTTHGDMPLRPRPARYRAPSWSWAAVDSPVLSPRFEWCLGRAEAGRFFEVLDCNTMLLSPNAPYGEVTTGRVTVRGYMQEGRLCFNPAMKYDKYTVCGLDEEPAISWIASLDALGDEKITSVYCLWVNEADHGQMGLILVPVEGEACFSRIGTFDTAKREHKVNGKQWLVRSGERRVIDII
ncbi:HET-domain-containing protein [Mycena sanguinolenta]|uniref:HET-domain-containing protein n=1 Tax=Mycena sanguinolenta TaxID=230812 RepID=A0A8H6YI48_9AGAR|nr:HET-domain-containing protein [Mycena sanguinolenta]